MRSPIRWAGGKRTLMPYLRDFFPQPTHFLDLFSGSASVAFNYASENTWINDINFPLQNFMRHLQTSNIKLTGHANYEKDYYKARTEFNMIWSQIQLSIQSPAAPLSQGGVCVEASRNREIPPTNREKCCRLADLFYYLNKTSFNGLYRVNKANLYNAPYGDTTYFPNTGTIQQLQAYSQHMTHWSITALRWQDALGQLALIPDSSKYQIYADPPYLDLYDGYSREGFKWKETLALLEYLTELPNPILLSNTYHKPLITAAKNRGWNVYAFPARSSIAADPESRRNRRECLFYKKGETD